MKNTISQKAITDFFPVRSTKTKNCVCNFLQNMSISNYLKTVKTYYGINYQIADIEKDTSYLFTLYGTQEFTKYFSSHCEYIIVQDEVVSPGKRCLVQIQCFLCLFETRFYVDMKISGKPKCGNDEILQALSKNTIVLRDVKGNLHMKT